MNTVYEILCKANAIKDNLNLHSIIVVLDQAIYSKAVEITWKHQETFQNIVLRMGTFHTIGVLLAVIGLRFGCAGLRDIIIESNVMAEGSAEKVLNGKHYNRGVRFHKLMYEACFRLIWESFVRWLENLGENDNMDTVTQALLVTGTLNIQDDVDEITFQAVLNDPRVRQSYSLFQTFCDILRSRNGTLSQFWMSYIDLVSLLLNLIRASREACWNLHLSSVREMIPWCFAYNRSNYSRYLPWYYHEMVRLPQNHPEIYAYLENGGFSCQIGPVNTYGRIPMDQTIEETINKDTQTVGGTKGFSTRKNAVSKYYITADDRANYVRKLRAMIDTRNQEFWHPDLTKPRILTDERDVKLLYSMMAETWKNPFELAGEELCSISTGSVPSPIAIHDMCNAKAKGEEAYQEFENERLSEDRTKNFFDPIPKMKLKTFENKTVKSKTSTEKEVELKADKNLFSLMTIVAQTRQLDMKKVFCHPLGPVPWALSTSSGSMRKTSKAVLSQALEKLSAPVEALPDDTVTVIDAMSIVQKIKGNHKTFGEVSMAIYRKVLAEAKGSRRIDVVF
jgi:hypothetical protein